MTTPTATTAPAAAALADTAATCPSAAAATGTSGFSVSGSLAADHHSHGCPSSTLSGSLAAEEHSQITCRIPLLPADTPNHNLAVLVVVSCWSTDVNVRCAGKHYQSSGSGRGAPTLDAEAAEDPGDISGGADPRYRSNRRCRTMRCADPWCRNNRRRRTSRRLCTHQHVLFVFCACLLLLLVN